jgi:hypothetical protein
MRLIIESDYCPVSGEHAEESELDRAHQLVDEFLVFVKESDVGNDFIDEIELPVPKSLLVPAFSRVIAAERRPAIKGLLIKAGMMLAHYLEGLGPRIRVRPGLPQLRPEPSISRRFAQRRERTLLAVAEERVRLAETYHRAIQRSLQ